MDNISILREISDKTVFVGDAAQNTFPFALSTDIQQCENILAQITYEPNLTFLTLLPDNLFKIEGQTMADVKVHTILVLVSL